MQILILLPLSTFIFSFISIHSALFSKDYSRRSIFLITYISIAFFIALTTEVLSLFNQIAFPSFLIIWCVATITSGFFAFKALKRENRHPLFSIPRLTWLEIILLTGVIIICSATAIIAYKSPPNNYDSMTYHMSRVANWIQHHNVNGYPTQVLRQLWLAPFAEFCILHLQVLTNSDLFANFVQWLSMIGCLFGVSLIAKQLSSNRLGQICAAVFCATIPMGILKSTNTKASFTLSLLILCLIHFTLKLRKTKHHALYILLGASLGLIALTKATGLLFCLPFLIWMSLLHIKNFTKKTIPLLLLTGIIALSINAGHFARNYKLGKHILSPVKSSKNYTNEEHTPRLMISNTVKNAALHLGTPWIKVNKQVDQSIRQFHKLLKIDIDDPRITFLKIPFTLPVLAFHEDHAGNPLHLLIIIITVLALIFLKRNQSKKERYIYLAAAIAGCLLFSFMVKWQPWHSRLHLPLFIIFAPFIGAALRTERNNKTIFLICLTLIVCSYAWTFKNISRPLISQQNIFSVEREKAYFFNRPDYLGPFESITGYLDEIGCHEIALDTHGDIWEYPFWQLFNNKLKNFRIRRINVKNESKKLPIQPTDDFTPCASIGFKKKNNTENIDDQLFIRTRYFAPLSVHVADTTNSLRKQNCMNHFMKRRKFDQIANTLFKNINSTPNKSQNNINQYIHLRKTELAEAELVDTDLLNSIYPSMGTQFKEKLIKGLQTRLTGYATGNQKQHRVGGNLINEWYGWIAQNKTGIEKGFNQ